MKLIKTFAAAAAGLLAGSQAHAVILSGELTGGSAFTNGGTFVKLSVPFMESTPDNSVGNNTFQTNNVYGFDEEQNIVAPGLIQTDVGNDVPQGAVVASHYIFFDPVNATVQAKIRFDAPIFGVATSTTFLQASDFLANTGVNYLNPTLRGLEGGDSVAIDPMDVSGKTLLISFRASTPGDYVRVFTQFSPEAEIPVPGAAFLFAPVIAGLFGLRRKMRKA